MVDFKQAITNDLSNPFTYVNDISFGKKGLLTDENENKYSPYLTNRSLSYHLDSLFEANEMNIHPELHNKLQFSYLLHTVRSRKRFAKWAKRVKTEEQLQLLCNDLNINIRLANEVFDLLTDEDIEQLKQESNVGGVLSG